MDAPLFPPPAPPGDAPALWLAVALLCVAGIIGLYDIVVAFGRLKGPTVSEVIYGWGQQFPPLILFLGLLLGHLFWPVRK